MNCPFFSFTRPIAVSSFLCECCLVGGLVFREHGVFVGASVGFASGGTGMGCKL